MPNGDLFKVLTSGEASVVTDQIDTFTENGILLKSGRELEADIIVTATGLNVQMLGGMELFVDGEARELREQMTYKAVLVEDIPNLAWIFGYTNASWTLKSDIAATYLCRLLKHMDENGHTVATPRDVEDSAMDIGMFDQLQSGYVQRAKDTLPAARRPSTRGRCSCTTKRTPRCCSKTLSTTVCCSSAGQPSAPLSPENACPPAFLKLASEVK